MMRCDIIRVQRHIDRPNACLFCVWQSGTEREMKKKKKKNKKKKKKKKLINDDEHARVIPY